MVGDRMPGLLGAAFDGALLTLFIYEIYLSRQQVNSLAVAFTLLEQQLARGDFLHHRLVGELLKILRVERSRRHQFLEHRPVNQFRACGHSLPLTNNLKRIRNLYKIV